MSLSIYNLYENLILESVSSNEVEQWLEQPYAIQIIYKGDKDTDKNSDGDSTTGKDWRTIYPYVLGVSPKGKLLLRAYQPDGDTKTENAKWKTFAVEGIHSWIKSGKHMGKLPISDYDASIPEYHLDGSDKKMVSIKAYREYTKDIMDKPYDDKNLDKVNTKMKQRVDKINKGDVETPAEPVTNQPIAKPLGLKQEPKIEPTQQVTKNKPLGLQKEPVKRAKSQDIKPLGLQPEPKKSQVNKPPINKYQSDITAPEEEAELEKQF